MLSFFVQKFEWAKHKIEIVPKVNTNWRIQTKNICNFTALLVPLSLLFSEGVLQFAMDNTAAEN